MSLITATALGKSFGAQDVFSGITVSIPKHARIGLVGPNGVGKTTLLRILLGEESASEGSVLHAKGLRMGYLAQETPADSHRTLWDECLGALESVLKTQQTLRELEGKLALTPDDGELMTRYGRLQERFESSGGYTYESRVRQVLSGLGFSREDETRPLSQLSGGQRTRAVLARLLLSDSDLLLLDEPTNHLDVQAMEWLEGYLRQWPGAVLLVSHDRYFLDQAVTVIWEMNPAIEIYHGNYSAYLQQREARLQRQMEEFEAQQEFVEKEEEYIRRNMAGQNTRQAQGRLKRLERLLSEAKLSAPSTPRRMRFGLEAAERSGELVIQSEGLAVGYADAPQELFSVPNLVLQRAECAAVMGPNGAGKTTFLKTLLGLLQPLAGDARLGGSVKVAYFAQAHEGLNPEMTLMETIRAKAPSMLDSQIRNFLAAYLFMEDDVFKKVETLSGGERGRLALACLSLTDANLLLLDEPTNHLDLASQDILQKALQAYPGTILLVSHDRYLIDATATQVWEVLPDERSLRVFKGSYSQYREEILKVQEGRTKRKKTSTGKIAPETKKPGRISLKQVRLLEEQISGIEEEIKVCEEKLAHPLEAFESVAELGREYMRLQAKLEEKIKTWDNLFTNQEQK